MSTTPSVSVIVIFLNEEKFIEEAIQSVLVQTYEDWELLLVDDGSTDGSTKIALRYAEQYPDKVLYLEHEGHQNRGMSASRNLGVRHAKGEYIALLDADDVWLEHKLQQQVAIMNSHPEAGMVYGNQLTWYSWTGDPKDAQRDFVPELVARSSALFEPSTLLTVSYPLGNATPPCPSNHLSRREMVERVGGFEESFSGVHQLSEDQAFLYKVYLKESLFVASEGDCWVKYRQHPDSYVAVARKRGDHITGRRYFLDWLEKYLSEQGVKDAEVWKLLREEQLVVRVRAHAWDREWKRAIRDLLVLACYHPRGFVRGLARAYRKLRLRQRGQL